MKNDPHQLTAPKTALREDGWDLRLFGSMYCGTMPPGIFHFVFHFLSGVCNQLRAILTFPESVFPKNPVVGCTFFLRFLSLFSANQFLKIVLDFRRNQS